MARRSKSSAFDDLIDCVSMLPWWVGLTMAPIAFVLARAWAASERAGMQADPNAAAGILYLFALLLQYLVPLACLLGALVSALRRQQRKSLAADMARAASTETLHAMSWREFEMAVGEGFRQRGYQVEETGGAGADGGVDLVLRKDREKYLVQCKQWRAQKVGVIVVRELYGVMAASGAAGGIVVTSGRFTGEAHAFARGRNIDLLDGTSLLALMRVQPQRSMAEPSASPRAEAPAATAEVTGPVCPRCHAPMVRRVAQRGASAGEGFWGCSTFPACRGTI